MNAKVRQIEVDEETALLLEARAEAFRPAWISRR
jgi:hypothetical protein